MKTTIVPAQITTVEDRIAGNFSMTQIVLLLLALVSGCIVYMVTPPSLQFAFYKIPLIAGITFLCSLLAIRVKEKIILQWIIILLRYTKRPRYFISNKNDLAYRVDTNLGLPDKQQAKKPQNSKSLSIGKSLRTNLYELESAIANPNAKVHITFGKKGGVNVSVS